MKNGIDIKNITHNSEFVLNWDKISKYDNCKHISSLSVSPALVNVIKAIAELEKSALEINRTGQVFQIPGVKLNLGQSNVQVTSKVVCSPGKIRISAFCGEWKCV